MSEPDADHHRYRALLRAADDEPKRLALIQLLIDEGARDRFAARLKPSKPEPLPEYQRFLPFAAPLPAQRASHEVAGAGPPPRCGENPQCWGGGDGPKYVQGPVRVVGTDHFHLDSNGDGVGCE